MLKILNFSKTFFIRKYFISKYLLKFSNIKQTKLINLKNKNRLYSLRKLTINNLLIKNTKLLQLFQTYQSVQDRKITNIKTNFIEQSFITKYTPITANLVKDITIKHFQKKSQFLIFLNELCYSLKSTNIFLLQNLSLFKENKLFYLKNTAEYTLFYNYLYHVFYQKNSIVSFSNTKRYVNNLSLNNFGNYFINNIFYHILNKNLERSHKSIVRFNTLDMISYFDLKQNFWEQFGLPVNISSTSSTQSSQQFVIKKLKVISNLKRRTQKLSLVHLRYFTFNISKDKFNLNYFWKHNNILNTSSYSNVLPKFTNIYKNNLFQRKTSIQLVYILTRIENKLKFYKNSDNFSIKFKKLNQLRNLLLHLINEKKIRNRINYMILTNKNVLARLRVNKWKVNMINFLKHLVQKVKVTNNIKLYQFIKLLSSRLSLGRKTSEIKHLVNQSTVHSKLNPIKSFFFNKKNRASNMKMLDKSAKTELKAWHNKNISLRKNWLNSKAVLSEKHLTVQQNKAILSSWINRPVDLFFINALALTKFSFKNERFDSPNNNPNTFLSILDRDFINKYKYVGIYIKDLVRVAFISIFFKKPSFLAKFIAFQLSKLPRNRKETNFIRFLIKVIKTFAAERKEILGIRIRFKGRVNRWRRTKFILSTRGTLPLQTISERIEQGTSQAVNKKGAVGIRIWLRYKQSFSFTLKDHILKYIQYSKLLKTRNISRTLLAK